jgi:glycosyltransferase involved in cell wall biosynthesis
MYELHVDVVIPALNEAAAIGPVVRAIPRTLVRSVIVVDNGSTDATAAVARAAGALVTREPRRGYGAACLAGVARLPPGCAVVVFLDGDGSDDSSRLFDLVAPIVAGDADLVVGTRTVLRGYREVFMPAQRVGNWLASAWLRRRFGLPATDLGPFRAIRRSCLDDLRMSDRGYGWTVEMQIKAARAGLRYREVPVACLPRCAGRSKVSGTIGGTLGAATKILGVLAWHDLRAR